MKTGKKISIFALILALVLGLSACSADDLASVLKRGQEIEEDENDRSSRRKREKD